MTTLDIHTIAFPDDDLRAAVEALVPAAQHADVAFTVWSSQHTADNLDLSAIDAVVLPYMDDAAGTVAKLGELPNIKLLQTQSTGYDVVADYLDKVAVTTGSGAHTAATAELAVGLALTRLRNLDGYARNMASGTWGHDRRPSLADRRVMIVGVGDIGEAIRARLEPFEVEITRVGSRARTDEHGTVHGNDDLPELLPQTEIVILITPLTASTHHLVDAEFLASLPDGALIVNVARGAVVDTDALLAELQSGRLQAALDVVDPEPLPADHPLWQAPNTFIAPHVGGDTTAFRPRLEKIIAEQVRRIQAGDDLLNRVG